MTRPSGGNQGRDHAGRFTRTARARPGVSIGDLPIPALTSPASEPVRHDRLSKELMDVLVALDLGGDRGIFERAGETAGRWANEAYDEVYATDQDCIAYLIDSDSCGGSHFLCSLLELAVKGLAPIAEVPIVLGDITREAVATAWITQPGRADQDPLGQAAGLFAATLVKHAMNTWLNSTGLPVLLAQLRLAALGACPQIEAHPSLHRTCEAPLLELGVSLDISEVLSQFGS